MEAGSETTTALERRRDRRRTVGYVVSVTLWVVALLPLAAKSIEEGGGLRSIEEGGGIQVIGAFAGAVVFSLGVAALIRFGYTRIRRRPVMSPWLFLLGAVIAVLSLAGRSGS